MQELDFPKDVLGQQGQQLQTVRVLVNPKSEELYARHQSTGAIHQRPGGFGGCSPPPYLQAIEECVIC